MPNERGPSEEEQRARLLQEVDIPEILVRALDRVEDSWVVLWAQRELLRLGSPEEAQEIAEHPRPALRQPNLRFEAARAKKHLDFLRDRGFDFDFVKGTITYPSGPKGGAPSHLLSRLVVALFEELPLPKGRRVGNYRNDREEIARILRPYFGELDPKRGGRIGQSIHDYLRP